MGYFGSHIPHGGGAKLPTLSKITPDASITPKLTHNVELLYYFQVLYKNYR